MEVKFENFGKLFGSNQVANIAIEAVFVIVFFFFKFSVLLFVIFSVFSFFCHNLCSK